MRLWLRAHTKCYLRSGGWAPQPGCSKPGCMLSRRCCMSTAAWLTRHAGCCRHSVCGQMLQLHRSWGRQMRPFVLRFWLRADTKSHLRSGGWVPHPGCGKPGCMSTAACLTRPAECSWNAGVCRQLWQLRHSRAWQLRSWWLLWRLRSNRRRHLCSGACVHVLHLGQSKPALALKNASPALPWAPEKRSARQTALDATQQGLAGAILESARLATC